MCILYLSAYESTCTYVKIFFPYIYSHAYIPNTANMIYMAMASVSLPLNFSACGGHGISFSGPESNRNPTACLLTNTKRKSFAAL